MKTIAVSAARAALSPMERTAPSRSVSPVASWRNAFGWRISRAPASAPHDIDRSHRDLGGVAPLP